MRQRGRVGERAPKTTILKATMSRPLEDKIAIITGAGSGIGRASAQLFAERGARVLLAGRREAPLQELVRSLGEDRAAYVCVDVTKHRDNARLFDEAQRKFGGCDIFVASAGAEGVSELIENYPIEVFDEVMAVNVRGVFLGLQSAMPMMRTRGGGSIVIVSSIAGIKARNTHNSAYVASKHAEVGLMRTAAMEGAPHSIRVNVVLPGPTDTEMVRRIEESRSPGAPEKTRAALLAQLPLRRYGTAEEVAQVIAFLASDAASISTGGVFAADGGLSAI
jgi:NAD(P)-dependent dehydrogenase (short-subunit alcohol dehydrogenase family)